MTGQPLPIPRPPVSENEIPRRRTKKACLTCQRKKLKCNGLQPCTTCISRNNTCTYASVSPEMSRSRVRHYRETSTHSSNQLVDMQRTEMSAFTSHTNERMAESCNLSPTRSMNFTQRRGTGASDTNVSSLRSAVAGLAPVPVERSQAYQADAGEQFEHGAIEEFAKLPENDAVGDRDAYLAGTGTGNGPRGEKPQTEDFNGNGNLKMIGRGQSGTDEGERLNEQSRLLNDGKGRLLYLGDSASLSFLDTVRHLVENTLGPSDFTKDPRRHKLVEGSISVRRKPTPVLPDREAAEFLIDSFFSNTVGILYILDREACAHEVAQIYENPLGVEPSRLSIFNLIFAVGLQMTRSSAGHSFRGSQILKRLDASPDDRAEMFYLNATYHNDPVHGFEDGDITSIQALLLITVFMLTVAKRNAAWAFFGMAVRSAYALGLHRKETDLGFAPSEQRIRRNIWKSLYVMDCFISAMLGRPNGINSRDAPQSSLASDEDDTEKDEGIETDALTASVGASRLIGDILSCIYAERKISVKLAQHLSSKFRAWKTSLPPSLHWHNISSPDEDPRATLAQLHVNLSYFHGIILLTRPFLLQRIISLTRGTRGDRGVSGQSKLDGKDETSSTSAEPFLLTCVRSAVYTIDAVQSALLKRALPRRDPFVIYWLFSAALIVFSNAFATVCTDVDTARAMQTALSLHQYLGEADPLAKRYNQILVAFHAAISRKDMVAANGPPTASRESSENIFNAFFGGFGNAAVGTTIAQQPLHASLASLDHRRNTEPISYTSLNTANISTASQAAADWQPFFQPSSMQGSSTAGALVTGREGATAMTNAVTGISPPDYCLDFDAFFNNVEVGGSESASQSQDMNAHDMWMPLYGTMDIG